MRKLKLKRNEVIFLKKFIRKGKKNARTLQRANILLLLNQREIGDFIAEKLNTHRDTIYNVKRRYLDGGLNSALFEKSRPGQPVKYDQKKKTEIIAQACTTPPEGRKRWTVRLLAQEMSKQDGFKTINRETIRLTLKKVAPSLG